MKRNKKKNLKLIVLILLLMLGIGFAALAANLKIDGTLNVSKTSWDVHFENVNITTGSVTANPAPTSDNTTTTEMTYTINFTKPGDFFEFTVDIVNKGTIDAMVDVVSNNAYADSTSTTPITLPNYLSSTVTYSDGVPIAQNQELLHNTSEKIKVRVEFKTDINVSDLPSSGNTSIVFKFVGDYKQADENAVSTYDWRLPEGRTKDNLEVGDEICTRDQCFNFLHYDGTNNEDIVMLSKYNLKVGNIINNSGTKTGEYTSGDSEYGLQSSETRGYAGPVSPAYGTVAFSATNYWTDGNNLKSPYNENDTIYYDSNSYIFKYSSDDTLAFPTVYDGQYKGAPGDANYSVAYYVDGYKTKLTEYGVTIKDTRLLTYAEATDSSIGCDSSNYSCPTNGFITNTSFWLGSTGRIGGVWCVFSYGSYFNLNVNFDYYNLMGVRPVVVISKDSI